MLIYAGQVGTGFTATHAAALLKRLAPALIDEPVVDVPPGRLAGRWVRLTMSVIIEHRDHADRGLLRHAAFKGIAP